MGFTAPLVGGSLGLMGALYANAVRGLPLMRRAWPPAARPRPAPHRPPAPRPRRPALA